MQLKKILLFVLLSAAAQLSFAQADSISVLCPLANGALRIIRSSDKVYEKTSEYGVMITSRLDSLVQACYEGKVVIVKIGEEKKYDIVISFQGYYFWYAGVLAPRIREGAKVKPGDIIGTYNPGDLLELLMFYQEEPVNPRKYLKCK